VTALYNDNDPKVCAWLEQLILAGLIAPGTVLCKSITEVTPDDVRGHTQVHLFAGIGGWSYALRLAGWPDDRPVWTGSCPCQPFSSAGKRQGRADERHLWPVMFDLVRECRPPVVFGEQVEGAVRLGWLDGVFADLEGADYACGSAVLGAHSVGAPHIRQRLYWVGHAASGEALPANAGQLQPCNARALCGLADAASIGLERCWRTWAGWAGLADAGGLEPPAGNGRQQGWTEPDGRSVASGRGTGWGDYEVIPCGDGKSRRIEPGLAPLASRLSDYLDRLRAIETSGLREITAYAKRTNGHPDEVVRMVQHAIHSKASWETKPTRGRERLCTSPILLDFLLCVAATRNGAAERSGFEKAGHEARRRIVRGVWNNEELIGSSCGWKSDEQRGGEPPDSLLELSWILARLAAAHRQVAIKAHAASGRVTMLRGYGNAIVPQVAAAFVAAYMESAQ